MQEQARSARQQYSDAIFDVLMQGSRYVNEYHWVQHDTHARGTAHNRAPLCTACGMTACVKA